ncbi:hypothetical protein D046_5510, partial [Vibrio parahaemolyticus V-223/04]
SFSA